MKYLEKQTFHFIVEKSLQVLNWAVHVCTSQYIRGFCTSKYKRGYEENAFLLIISFLIH